MLTKNRAKPNSGNIQSGDEYKAWGQDVGVSGGGFGPDQTSNGHLKGFSMSGGLDLGSIGVLKNPLHREATRYDIEAAFVRICEYANADNKLTEAQFVKWCSKKTEPQQYLGLGWDDMQCKRVWAEIDVDKLEVVTLEQFKEGLGATNSDVVLFYHTLLSGAHLHPNRALDWKLNWGPSANKRYRYVRQIHPNKFNKFLKKFAKAKKSSKKNKASGLVALFCSDIRDMGAASCNIDFWQPVLAGEEKQRKKILGTTMIKTLTLLPEVLVLAHRYPICAYEMMIYLFNLAMNLPFFLFRHIELIGDCFCNIFQAIDINDSDQQGVFQWAHQTFVGVIKLADRSTQSIEIVQVLSSFLAEKLDEESKNNKKSRKKKKIKIKKLPPTPTSPKNNNNNNNNDDDDDIDGAPIGGLTLYEQTWNLSTKVQIMYGLNVAIDCTEEKMKISSHKTGQKIILLIYNFMVLMWNREENYKEAELVDQAMEILSRLDGIDTKTHDKILRIVPSSYRKKYKREYGLDKIQRHTLREAVNTNNRQGYFGGIVAGGSGKKRSSGGAGKYTQRYRIGALGAGITAKKIERSAANNSHKKERIIDIDQYSKLFNPFELIITDLDILCSFRYADVNQDNAITLADFRISLVKVGLNNLNEQDINKMWEMLLSENSTNSNNRRRGGDIGVELKQFTKILHSYPLILHKWLCRIVSCNHLGRQPLKSDPSVKELKKILKDQRKLSWKQRIDALYCVARLFSRTNYDKKEFQTKFKTFLNRILEHCSDPRALVVRAACITLTRIMIYKKNYITKYNERIMTELIKNFLKKDSIVRESSFGCFANLVLHVPDTKRLSTLKQLQTMINTKKELVRAYGWRLVAVNLERILGLKKARPATWWNIMEQVFAKGTREKSIIVQKDAIRCLYVFEKSDNSKVSFQYVDKYISKFPKPKGLEEISAQMISEIDGRMTEYQDVAAAQADALDVYSLISTEKEADDDIKKQAAQDYGSDYNDSSAGGMANSAIGDGFGIFDNLIDNAMKSDNEQHIDNNQGLGPRLILHRISASLVADVYEIFDLNLNSDNHSIILASLKYLGINNIQRGQLVLLVSEIQEFYITNNNSFSSDIYAFLVKHCYGMTDQAWRSYLQPKDDLLKQIDAEHANIEEPQDVCSMKIQELMNIENDYYGKCSILSYIYHLFVTPKVENEELIFESMMNELHPVLCKELENQSQSIFIQEICIFLCRLVQYHTARFQQYAHTYYEILFHIISINKKSLRSHACYRTILCIASHTTYLNHNALKLNYQSLLNCIKFSAANNIEYQLLCYKTLLISIMTNIPIIKDEQIKIELFQIWSIIRNKIYSNIANNAPDLAIIRLISCNILAYLISCEYLNIQQRDNKEMTTDSWNEIIDIKKEKLWEKSVIRDIKPINETEVYFTDMAIDYGWDQTLQEDNEFKERDSILNEWYKLEEKANNLHAMASIKQIMTSLNHTRYKVNKKNKIKNMKSRPQQTTNNHDHNKPALDLSSLLKKKSIKDLSSLQKTKLEFVNNALNNGDNDEI